MKTKTIHLSYPHTIVNGLAWKILRVTDSIDYTPGHLLLKEKVEALCNARDWKVTIQAP